MGAVLAQETNGQNVAIIQLGSTLPSTTPPTRIAEEYAMLDCISGGRLVAGFPDRAAEPTPRFRTASFRSSSASATARRLRW